MIRLTLTDEQAQLVAKACEFYARIRMGQFGEIVYNCAEKHYVDDPEGAARAWLALRNYIYPELHGVGHSYGYGKFEDADKAFDVYQVIRTLFGDPRGVFSTHELPICERIEGDATDTNVGRKTNDPLTIEELRKMNGEPVYCPEEEMWGIVKVDEHGKWKDKPFLLGRWRNVDCEYDIEKRKLKVYRHKPEEGK